MTRKDIYVFKAKFGVGNFEIEVYKLPVKKSWLSILKKMISLKREAFLLRTTWRGWKILRKK